MAKYVVAEVMNATQAQSKVDELMGQGYPAESISLIGNKDVVGELQDAGVATESYFDAADDRGEEESVWERIKHFFGADDDDDHGKLDHKDYRALMADYRNDIDNGNVLVVVDDAYVPANLRDTVATQDTGYWDRKKEAANIVDKDNETIRLQEERLNVDKDMVDAGDVVVKKRVVEENQTINVPVRHEEVVVERRKVNDGTVGTADFEDESFTIPLHEEQVRVTKEPVVTEEVNVRRRDVTESQQVSASLRKEELDVQKDGNVIVNDTTPDSTGAPL